MNEIQNIITERVDDIPLLLEQMQRMGLPTLLDDAFSHPRQLARPQLGLGDHHLAQLDFVAG